MGGVIVDARNRGDSLENVISIINGGDMSPGIKSVMARIAVTIYSNPSLKRADVVAYGLKAVSMGCRRIGKNKGRKALIFFYILLSMYAILSAKNSSILII